VRLDEALSEYERGLEKIADYSYQRLLDYEALRMNPVFIRVPDAEKPNA
jgi:exonuclease VII small subunit